MSVDSDRDCCHHHKKCSKCRRRCPRCRFECDIECRECPRCHHCFDNCCECCECGCKHDHCWQIYGRPPGRFSYAKKINHAVVRRGYKRECFGGLVQNNQQLGEQSSLKPQENNNRIIIIIIIQLEPPKPFRPPPKPKPISIPPSSYIFL